MIQMQCATTPGSAIRVPGQERKPQSKVRYGT